MLLVFITTADVLLLNTFSGKYMFILVILYHYFRSAAMSVSWIGCDECVSQIGRDECVSCKQTGDAWIDRDEQPLEGVSELADKTDK